MSIRHVSIVEAKTQLSRLLEDVLTNADVIYITRNKTVVAQLCPAPADASADPASMWPAGRLACLVNVGGLRPTFQVELNQAASLIQMYGSGGGLKAVGLKLPDGHYVTIPTDAVISIAVPAEDTFEITGPEPPVSDLNPSARFAEIVMMNDQRFRVTSHVCGIVSSHLASGTPIIGFRPLESAGVLDKRAYYVPRAHIKYAYLGTGGEPIP